MFLPTTRKELKTLGWDRLDVILVTGDTYVDSPFLGVVLIGKTLLAEGYKVGIIAQPSLDDGDDIRRLGEPVLFWGITAGCADSMVANTTATMKRRRRDDLTPGGANERRPNRALIAYANLIRRHFKNTVPLVLGGLEASMRRISHYDYWTDSVRRSVLFDAKADVLVHGMGEGTVLALADRLKNKADFREIRGTCHAAAAPVPGYVELPSYEEAASDPEAFTRMFMTFWSNNDPVTAKGLCQRHDKRYLIHNPPRDYLETAELDRVYALPFERAHHPFYECFGGVRALETIQFSITTHRGCYGECNFCAIAAHQGRRIRSRSEASVVAEARAVTRHPNFKGVISDLGGPTANMYGMDCDRKRTRGACADKRCLFPTPCVSLSIDHSPLLSLMRKVGAVPGVRLVRVASGLRHDLILNDEKYGEKYLRALIDEHASGQLKIAPEHVVETVTRLMGKPGPETLLQFKSMFDRLSAKSERRCFLTYYFIAAHPGCDAAAMREARDFVHRHLRITPAQTQVFTPTPSTLSSLMYHTGRNPFDGSSIFVEKGLRGKNEQKQTLVGERRPTRKREKRSS